MYKTIDLFAGIGGIRLGFEQAFGNDVSNIFTKTAVKLLALAMGIQGSAFQFI